tara:strand:+ start:9543 stop:9857 length:315 start_codon:yes stop_codon:yes gene_type:complete
MISVSIKNSTKKDKKLMAIFFKDGKKIKTQHFGSAPNKDFTIYSKEGKAIAEKEKKKYIARHKVRENWNDFFSAGALSRFILWNKPTKEASIKDYAKRFNLTLL